jgi:hypothetical protein
MRLFILFFALAATTAPSLPQDQSAQLSTASDAITRALNAFAAAADPLRSSMTNQQRLATALAFAAAMSLEDNSLSLSAVCQLQQLSRSPSVSRQRILEPLLGQYRTSSAQQTANVALALPFLPSSLARQANLVMVAVTNAAAVIDRGC